MKELTYPRNCRRNIRRLTECIGVSAETAYAMMLMTSALMDLNPWDEDVVAMILEDCGLSPEAA